jgi:multiple sugar transport system substrate-binding protein
MGLVRNPQRFAVMVEPNRADYVPGSIRYGSQANVIVYATGNTLTALDELVSAAGIKAEDVYESDWKASQYVGKQWGLPQTVGGSAFLLFYNKDAFEEAGLDPATPPTTWAEALDAAKKLFKGSGNQIERLGLGIPTDSWAWLNHLAGNDAPWLSDDGREVLMDNEGAVEALQFLVDVIDAQGGAENVAAFSAAAGDADPFMSGRTAMAYSGVWNYYILQTNAPDLNYGSALAPNNNGDWHEANYGPHLYTIPLDTKHPDEAWKLLLWVTREEGGCDFLTAQLRPSPWKKCTEESPVAKTADYWPVVLNALATTRPEPLTPMFNQFASFWNDMTGLATMKEMEPAEAVQMAAEEMKKINDEYWSKQG